MPKDLNAKVVTATKWSAVTEILAKLLTPIVSMILARLLTPEAFGVVTTITMIVTFAEIFTDAGFQKYLIQHEFPNSVELYKCTNVAFWSNLIMSICLWGGISIFSSQLANIVGNPGLGHVIIIACFSIPIEAFSSIQMALYKRNLDFRTLFKVRLSGIIVPLFVTVPLAFWLHSYWALVIGTIVVNLVNAILLTVFSKWKPQFYFNLQKLKEMLSFSIWSMIEQISIWFTNYFDVFIVGTMLSQYYLGLYKTSSALVGQIMGLVTAVTTPILFSALSRLQGDNEAFHQLFFKFQKIVGILVIPLGVGIFLFSDLATVLLLGNQWMEASGFVGLWALTSSITIVLSHYASEVYRAKGRPKLSVLAQLSHLVVLWPAVRFAAHYSFEALYTVRSLVRLELIIVNLIILAIAIKIPILKMFTNILPSCLSALCMSAVFVLLPKTELIWWQLLYIGVCIIVYLSCLMAFREERSIITNIKQILKP